MFIILYLCSGSFLADRETIQATKNRLVQQPLSKAAGSDPVMPEGILSFELFFFFF